MIVNAYAKGLIVIFLELVIIMKFNLILKLFLFDIFLL